MGDASGEAAAVCSAVCWAACSAVSSVESEVEPHELRSDDRADEIRADREARCPDSLFLEVRAPDERREPAVRIATAMLSTVETADGRSIGCKPAPRDRRWDDGDKVMWHNGGHHALYCTQTPNYEICYFGSLSVFNIQIIG